MSDQFQPPEKPKGPGHDPNSPFSEKLEDFIDALECLYIRGNSSGRRIFKDNWPAAVPLIMDERILIFDEQGIGNNENRDLRKELEKQAEEKRDRLLKTLENIEKLSINDGMLLVDFVKDFIHTHGPDFSLYVYAQFIVDKFPVNKAAEQKLSDDDLKVAQTEGEQPEEEEEEKPVIEEEVLLSSEERTELLGGMTPRLLPEDEGKKEEKTEKKVPRKERLRDPNYRPPVVGSSGDN